MTALFTFAVSNVPLLNLYHGLRNNFFWRFLGDINRLISNVLDCFITRSWHHYRDHSLFIHFYWFTILWQYTYLLYGSAVLVLFWVIHLVIRIICDEMMIFSASWNHYIFLFSILELSLDGDVGSHPWSLLFCLKLPTLYHFL